MVSARSTSAIAFSNVALADLDLLWRVVLLRLLQPAVEGGLRTSGRCWRLLAPGLLERRHEARARRRQLLDIVAEQVARLDQVRLDQLALGGIDRLEGEMPIVAVVVFLGHDVGVVEISGPQATIERRTLRLHLPHRVDLVPDDLGRVDQLRVVAACHERA